MSYREHAPAIAIALAPWLACTWERSGDGGAPVRVVPDGCIDIVWTQGAGTLVVGPNTTAFLVPVDAGVRVVGARMRPGAAGALLGIHAAALRDGRVALHEVWHDDGHRLTARLDADADPLGVLVTALTTHARTAAPPDRLVRAAVDRLQTPDARVETLAHELGVSARHLRRRFHAAVGYGPKRLARVLRLERALAAARDGEDLAWAAAAAGYADQAHFTNDCRALAGLAPATLLAG